MMITDRKPGSPLGTFNNAMLEVETNRSGRILQRGNSAWRTNESARLALRGTHPTSTPTEKSCLFKMIEPMKKPVQVNYRYFGRLPSYRVGPHNLILRARQQLLCLVVLSFDCTSLSIYALDSLFTRFIHYHSPCLNLFSACRPNGESILAELQIPPLDRPRLGI